MKLNFKQAVGRRASGVEGRKQFWLSTLGSRPSAKSGIALVITLILLSVTLVMAIAFLAISRRERGSVTTSTDTATARLAADSALANAEAQIIANVLSTTNPYNFGLVVSTNYIYANGYNDTADPTNVSYYDSSGNFLTGNNFLQNVANLFYLPRPPVFVVTNEQTGATEFRFYLDLNRNGIFDANGSVPNVDNTGTTNGTISEVGDPEWIGVLERPDVPHGPNNHFVSRYAFVAVPADSALDLNYIHNQSKRINPAQDGFLRNQGVGTWELNLAAFLTDLNTNQWDPNADQYFYNTNTAQSSTLGPGFDDALSLLRFRYSTNNPPTSATGDYNNLASLLVDNGNIDEYANGNASGALMTGTSWNNDFNDSGLGFPGADNPAHFFDLSSDLFDPDKSSTSFTNRLILAGNGNGAANPSTYDRYTFYRLLAQLGTDSSPESGKMNLNYDNLVYKNPASGVISETNFQSWDALTFFTNAADRMLRLYTTNWFQASPSNYLATYYGLTNFNYYYTNSDLSVLTNDTTGLGLTETLGVPNVLSLTNDTIPAFGITNIPVRVIGQFVYSPAVNRVLQLAANIYDATTNYFYPSVFRPTFLRDTSGNIFINGYQQVASVSGTGDPQLNQPIDATGLLQGTSAANYPNGVNVYGVPWIIGAKKYMPNFNEFSMEDIVQVTRTLQISRNTTNNTPPARIYTNSQMYTFSISNSIGVECWNSYTNNYPDPVTIGVRENLSMALTNGAASAQVTTNYPTGLITTNITVWPGTASNLASSFIVPFQTTVPLLQQSVYSFFNANWIPWSQNAQFEPNNFFVLPQFGLLTTNRLQVFMLDNGHVIDYVHFAGPDSYRNLNAELDNPDVNDSHGFWTTNLLGVTNQLSFSEGRFNPNQPPSEDAVAWNPPPVLGITTGPQSQAYFGGLYPPNSVWTVPGTSVIETNHSFGTQAPYQAIRTMVQYNTWQANDPLVHYLTSDLSYSGYDPNPESNLRTGITVTNWNNPLLAIPILPGFGQLDARYEPWGATSQRANQANVDQDTFNFAYKDSLVTNSDSWDFPTYKFPTVGWLGRVHRGTPWQTVFLKATNILDLAVPAANGLTTWTNWTGNVNPFDANNTAPVQDHLLFDVFSIAPNDNATRGQLSVNQDHLAAWSAVFSGMVVLTNTSPSPQLTGPSNSWLTISPAGVNGLNSPLGDLVTNINNMRANTNLFPLQAFTHAGDILTVPQLTEQSPFLNWNNSAQQQYGISDEVYEWLPQQMMSLLRDSSAPRYVIYSYGQTLKPAPNGIVTSGSQFFGMVTNYQIVSETATRAVVRVEDAKTTHPHIVVESFNILPPD
jgi:hypothetical protein